MLVTALIMHSFQNAQNSYRRKKKETHREGDLAFFKQVPHLHNISMINLISLAVCCITTYPLYQCVRLLLLALLSQEFINTMYLFTHIDTLNKQ